MSSEKLSRREWIKLTAIAGAGIATSPAGAFSFASDDVTKSPGRAFRIAHLTDSHTQPERRAAEGTIACLKHAQGLDTKPDLVVTGGDLIMDSFDADRARTKLQWDLYTKILRDECSLPIEHTLGNHDIWGWNKKKSGASGTEADYGKKWALDTLGLPKPYRSFDRGGWHFVILDSVMGDGDGYIGKLDDEQFDWLGKDLGAVNAKTPVIVVSHIPIFAACVLNDLKDDVEKTREFNVPGSWMMVDGKRIRKLFRSHPNVKLCLSGHVHQLDRVDFEGVTYICDGAVSGGWWKGPNEQCFEGYGVVDLFPDGKWAHQYNTYGWKA